MPLDLRQASQGEWWAGGYPRFRSFDVLVFKPAISLTPRVRILRLHAFESYVFTRST